LSVFFGAVSTALDRGAPPLAAVVSGLFYTKRHRAIISLGAPWRGAGIYGLV